MNRITRVAPFLVLTAFLSGLPGLAAAAPGIAWTRSGLGGYCYAAAVDPAGNVIVTGKTPTNSSVNMQTVKYSSDGVEKWAMTFDSSGVDRGFGVAASGLGEVYVVGQSGAGANPHFQLVKYSPAGGQLWATDYYAGTADFGQAVAVAVSGTVCLTGYSTVAGTANVRTIRLEATPGLLSDAQYNNGLNCYGYAVAVDSSGNSYVGGGSSSGASMDYRIIKYDGMGAEAWNKSWDGGMWDEVRGIGADQSGSVYVTGLSQAGAGYDIQTVKYDPAGNFIWARGWDNSTNDEGMAIAVEGCGSFYVAGFTTNDNTANKDFLLLKYDPGGNLLWSYSFGGSADDELHGAAIGPDGNLVVAGFTETNPFTLAAYFQAFKFKTALSGPETTPGNPVKSGKLVAAPNALDLKAASSQVVLNVLGKPGGESEIRIYDSAGRLVGSAKVTLNSAGQGSIPYGRTGWGGKHPAPGAYWAVASGGGVNDRKIFFVIAGRK